METTCEITEGNIATEDDCTTHDHDVTFEVGDTVTHPDFAGIALRIREHPVKVVTRNPLDFDDDDWDEELDPEIAIVVMVGDNQLHRVEVADLKPLDEDEFCSGCGQTGCGHGR